MVARQTASPVKVSPGTSPNASFRTVECGAELAAEHNVEVVGAAFAVGENHLDRMCALIERHHRGAQHNRRRRAASAARDQHVMQRRAGDGDGRGIVRAAQPRHV